MFQFLRLLSSIASVLSTLIDMWRKWKLKQEAREEVFHEIKKKEDEVARIADGTADGPSDPRTVSKRMRDGSF